MLRLLMFLTPFWSLSLLVLKMVVVVAAVASVFVAGVVVAVASVFVAVVAVVVDIDQVGRQVTSIWQQMW